MAMVLVALMAMVVMTATVPAVAMVTVTAVAMVTVMVMVTVTVMAMVTVLVMAVVTVMVGAMGNDNQESLANTILGGAINWLITMALFGVTAEFALWSSALFFCVSLTRTRIIRYYYRRKEDEDGE